MSVVILPGIISTLDIGLVIGIVDFFLIQGHKDTQLEAAILVILQF